MNLVLLFFFTLNDSKRSRIEPLSIIQRQGDARAVLFDLGPRGPPYVPRFYLGHPIPVYLVGPDESPGALGAAIGDGQRPDYVVLEGDEHFEERMARLKVAFPNSPPSPRWSRASSTASSRASTHGTS